MADITDPKAIEFTLRARQVATEYEKLYWMAKQLSRQWYAGVLGDVIPVSSAVVADGHNEKPLTGNDVVGIVSQCDALVAGADQYGYAVLNVWMKGSSLPLE